MFKKLKDKLAEEVKSSPQRIQQFAQAAQAAVTSASSSISDITNSDLFSIGDNETHQQPHSMKSQSSQNSQQNTFQDVSLVQPLQSPPDSTDYNSTPYDLLDNQRQRRLSNSSFASDVSFRLPSYETPSMYHLQSDMEVSASEAEERGFSSGTVSLDRVTKEQLYAAYRRTQERYTKYRTQYGDLARHYKLLERENAKARSVLVETQDKALRRISELREQCSLEQSAKAHLEKALRVDIEERNMKIEALNTKIQLLQSNSDISNSNNKTENNHNTSEADGDVQLINLSNDNDVKQVSEETAAEMLSLNNKIEKMEQLLTKYKDSLKTSKEKNTQINTELQVLSNELESKNKEIEQLKLTADHLTEAKGKIQELSNLNEELQNKINVYEFNKTREQSTLEVDYQKAQEEIAELRGKIEVFSKREEEYAISLAENKLSIHKELESKESEIRSLKDNLDVNKKEIQSLNIVINDYKKKLSLSEAERSKLINDSSELTATKAKIAEMESQIEELSKKCQGLEQSKTKADEGYKCLQLQLKQETAEKLAMIDRNGYLENRNSQLSEENAKKSTQITNLETQIQKKEKELAGDNTKKDELLEELSEWQDKYAKLESEIQEERDELIKLQSEIEKLLTNHELLQTQNIEFRKVVSDLKSENASLQEKVIKHSKLKSTLLKFANEINEIKNLTKLVSNDAKSLQIINNQALVSFIEQINYTLNNISQIGTNVNSDMKMENTILQQELNTSTKKYETMFQERNLIQDENNNLKSKISELELENNTMDERIKSITSQYEMATQDLNSVKEENENLLHKINELENNFQNLQIAIEFEKKENLDAIEKLNMLENAKQNLMENIKSMENQNHSITTELDTFKDKYRNAVEELDSIKSENAVLLNELKQKDGKIADMNTLQEETKNLTHENLSFKDKHTKAIEELDSVKCENAILLDEIKQKDVKIADMNTLQEENKNLSHENLSFKDKHRNAVEELDSVKCENAILLDEIKQKDVKIADMNTLQEENKNLTHENLSFKDKHRNAVEELDSVKCENAILLDEIKKKDVKIADMNTLQEENKNLTHENLSLRSQAENLADSYKLLETEINDVRKSHAEIVSEKDHLSEIIEKLESSSLKTTLNQDSQTDVIEEQAVDTIKVKEQTAVDDNIEGAIDENLIDFVETKPLQSVDENKELSDKYQSLKAEYDILKEDNRRFKSDIEGLQTYLTKISKENSILNDKLRELIATSEHSSDNNAELSDLLELKKEFQTSKEKIDDLLRENTLLIEENLELKDQLQTQNYPQPEIKSSNGNEKETSIYKEKYNHIQQVNSTLEKRLLDLEQMNKSMNGNVTQMQEKNEKLRLSNEKLERRLDEALVSLRHLHSLQENTELEYLRNILYEYLTGSGMHSVTLAKVLAAIVKFDDMQTKLVLQKEKERQGFLRQLGII